MSNKSESSNLVAWLMWSSAALFVFLQFLLQISPSTMINVFEQQLHLNTVSIGFLSSSFFYAYIPLQIPAGMLVDKYGCRSVLAFSILGAAVSCLIFAGAHGLWLAFWGRLLMGLFAAPAVVATMVLASQWLPLGLFALVAGLTEGLGMLGGAFGQNMLAYLMKHVGWRATFVWLALFTFILAIVIVSIVRDKKRGVVDASLGKGAVVNVWHNLLTVFRIRQVWLAGLFSGLLFAPIVTFASLWSVPYLSRLYNTHLSVAAGLTSLIFIGAAFGTPAAGWFSDKICRRKVMLQIGAFIALGLMLVITHIKLNLVVMAVLLFGLGFFSSVYAIPFALIRDIVPRHVRGTALAFVNTVCVMLGGPLLQPVIGWILAHKSAYSCNAIISVATYRSSLDVLSWSLLLGFILSFFICETYCRLKHEQ